MWAFSVLIICKLYFDYNHYNIIMEHVHNRRQKYMTNSLLDI